MLLSYILASRSRFLSTNLRVAQTPVAEQPIFNMPYHHSPITGNNMSVFTPSSMYQAYPPVSPVSEDQFSDYGASPQNLGAFGSDVRGYGHISNMY